jgi:hypothetical protein
MRIEGSHKMVGRCSVAAVLLCTALAVRMADAQVYFQGTDDKLWKVDANGSGENIGGYKTKSTPVVFGGHVYFQGTDDKFWQVLPDGTDGIQVGGGYKTSSPPFVAGHIFFRGTDDKLWRVNLDGSGGVNLGGYKTKSTPLVSGRFVFFQGTDNKLWRINIDGTGGINLGLNTTSAQPFATNQYVYFRGTDDRLLRINLDGTGGIQLAGYKTQSMPFVTDDYVIFRGTDDKLWRVNLDGSGGVNLGGYKTKSTPVVDTAQNLIYFQGTDDKLWRVNLDGSGGVNLGGYKTKSMPGIEWPTLASPRPKYVVLTLVYAPPGTNGGRSASQVEYSNGSSTGTTLSFSSSFKEGVSATLSGAEKLKDNSFGLSMTETSTNDSSLAIKKSVTNDIKVPGPSADGIDHDEDTFYLWLNPQFEVSVDPQKNLDWELGMSGPTMIIQKVFVGQLKNPSTMNAGLRQQLTAAGLTQADFAEILKLDPCWLACPPVDPNRFVPLPYTFPYDPPLHAADSVATVTQTLQSSVAYDMRHTVQTEYNVALSAGGPITMYLDLKLGDALTWTNTQSTASNNTSTQSATVTIGGPAFGYNSPDVDVWVYWDTIYNSFFFSFPPPGTTASASGTIFDHTGRPASQVKVTLWAGPKEFTTFTNARGEYRIYGAAAGRSTLSVEGESFEVSVGPRAGKATLHLTRN